jgi:transposase
MSVAAPLALRDGDKKKLTALVRSSSVRAALAQRARIVLLAAEGWPNTEIARRVGVSRPTVLAWRNRYASGGVAALDDLDRPGRPVEVDEIAIVVATVTEPPPELGITHWSARLLGDHLGHSFATIARVWRKWKLQPWKAETFKFSTDPELDAKIRDIVGLYLDPPERAVVLCVDEKSQTQALDRTDPADPPRPAGETDPRLRPARHHHPVRRARGRHRQGHRRLLPPAPPPGVPQVPQDHREGLPPGRAARRL